MQNAVHIAAESFRALIIAEGEPCGEITHSINRYGEASSYFDALGATIRVSDHHANEFFRVREISVYFEHATAEQARALIDEYRAFKAAQAPIIAARKAADEARNLQLRDQQFLADRRREWWDATLAHHPPYKGSRQHAIDRLKKAGVRCPF